MWIYALNWTKTKTYIEKIREENYDSLLGRHITPRFGRLLDWTRSTATTARSGRVNAEWEAKDGRMAGCFQQRLVGAESLNGRPNCRTVGVYWKNLVGKWSAFAVVRGNFEHDCPKLLKLWVKSSLIGSLSAKNAIREVSSSCVFCLFLCADDESFGRSFFVPFVKKF